MEPFRVREKQRGYGRSSLIWKHGLVDLELMWQRFQHAVKKMWEEETGQGESQMQRIRRLYHSNAAVRDRHLQYWERQHMASCDKSGAKMFANPTNPKPAVDKQSLVRKLLLRWEEAELRRALRQQKRKRLEHQRMEQSKKRRVKEEQRAERVRREALRQRMKNPHLTMDDLLGCLDGMF